MQFINEQQIEKIADQLGNDPDIFQATLEEFKESEPALLAYLFSEDTHAFTNPEREWLLYLGLTVLNVVAPFRAGKESISEKAILDAEEINWTQIQAAGGRNFRDRLNTFFEDTPQEDLLAFAEDSVIDDEDETISNEGREPLFIMLKTIIDVLTV